MRLNSKDSISRAPPPPPRPHLHMTSRRIHGHCVNDMLIRYRTIKHHLLHLPHPRPHRLQSPPCFHLIPQSTHAIPPPLHSSTTTRTIHPQQHQHLKAGTRNPENHRHYHVFREQFQPLRAARAHPWPREICSRRRRGIYPSPFPFLKEPLTRHYTRTHQTALTNKPSNSMTVDNRLRHLLPALAVQRRIQQDRGHRRDAQGARSAAGTAAAGCHGECGG